MDGGGVENEEWMTGGEAVVLLCESEMGVVSDSRAPRWGTGSTPAVRIDDGVGGISLRFTLRAD